jgi:hypothetical protein
LSSLQSEFFANLLDAESIANFADEWRGGRVLNFPSWTEQGFEALDRRRTEDETNLIDEPIIRESARRRTR